MKTDSSHDAILVPTWPLPWLQMQLTQLVWGLVLDRQGRGCRYFAPEISHPRSATNDDQVLPLKGLIRGLGLHVILRKWQKRYTIRDEYCQIILPRIR
jgi:hypothetical protein